MDRDIHVSRGSLEMVLESGPSWKCLSRAPIAWEKMDFPSLSLSLVSGE